MASKGFHKDMDAYLERRSGSQPRVVKKKKEEHVTIMDLCKQLVHKFTHFFVSADNINLGNIHNDVVVIRHSSSPASMFMKKMKKVFGRKKSQTVKVQEKPEEKNIDPALIANTIKNNRL